MNWRFAIGLLLGATASGSVRANPADTYGFGSRSIALGGAVAANASDSSANYYNPSGLSLHQSTEFSIGFVSATPRLKLGGTRTPVSSMHSLLLGLVLPGQLASLPFALGFASQVAGERLSRIVTFTDEEQRWLLFDNRPEQVYLSGNFALSPTDWLSLGAGYSFLASTSGRLSVTGRAVQPGFGSNTEFDSNLDHEVIADLTSVRYPQFGATFSPASWLSFAIVYRDEGKVLLEVNSDISGAVAIGPLDIPTTYILESKTVQSFVPRQLVFGSSLTWSTLRLNVDFIWTEWSGYPSPVSATRSEIDIESPPGLRLEAPMLPSATSLSQASMTDRVSLRVGVEHVVSLGPALQLPVRGGFAWDPSGATIETDPSLLDASRAVLSVGGGLLWKAPSELFPGWLSFNWHAQWLQLSPREVPALDREGPLTAEGHVFGLGANLTYRFSRGR